MGWASLTGSVAIAGCHSTPYYLKNNAAGTLDCPESAVQVDHGERIPRHARRYTAAGCGRTVTYVCPNVGTDCAPAPWRVGRGAWRPGRAWGARARTTDAG